MKLRRGVLLPIRPRRQTINHAPETTTSRAMRPPEMKGQLLRVAAAALRLHPAARTPRPSWTHPSSVLVLRYTRQYNLPTGLLRRLVTRVVHAVPDEPRVVRALEVALLVELRVHKEEVGLVARLVIIIAKGLLFAGGPEARLRLN